MTFREVENDFCKTLDKNSDRLWAGRPILLFPL